MISVIIPVKNGEATLEKCLTAIRQQTIKDQVEIIVLDSGSEDNSVAIAKSFRAKVIEIDARSFNHGLTRNIGVNHSSAHLLYFTVQDAYLAEADQLEKMALHFNEQELQAVVGMQATPHDKDKNPARWFKRFTKPETVFRHFPDGDFGSLSLQEQFKHCPWDNVNAMYRKSALLKIPFVKTDFSEDWLWVKDALTDKMKVAFDPSLVVYHYHHMNFDYSFTAQYIMNFSFLKTFGVYPKLPGLVKPALTSCYHLCKNDKITFREKLYWCGHNLLSTSAVFLSHLIFLVIGKCGGERLLAKSYNFFCAEVPQGKSKND